MNYIRSILRSCHTQTHTNELLGTATLCDNHHVEFLHIRYKNRSITSESDAREMKVNHKGLQLLRSYSGFYHFSMNHEVKSPLQFLLDLRVINMEVVSRSSYRY